jgi:hypothetical protein
LARPASTRGGDGRPERTRDRLTEGTANDISNGPIGPVRDSGRKAFPKPLEEGIAILNTIQDVHLREDIDIA